MRRKKEEKKVGDFLSEDVRIKYPYVFVHYDLNRTPINDWES